MVPPAGAQPAAPTGSERQGFFARITDPYRRHPVAPVNLSNSSRLEALLRAGRLYLSLQDTIALALENNLDIELQRYGAQVASASTGMTHGNRRRSQGERSQTTVQGWPRSAAIEVTRSISLRAHLRTEKPKSRSGKGAPQ